jgi:2-keto-4-pentenoate hydratase/2-oxohepta-3-ene-1,7-dioic acid hydratase in catechol pathway
MKFLTLENGYLGAVIEDTAVDLGAAARELVATLPAETLLDLVRAPEGAAAEVWAIAHRAVALGVACRPLAEVRPLAPIPSPQRNIFCLGLNYRAHVKEFEKNQELPDAPIVFTKSTTSIAAPGDDIPAHTDVTQGVDYEAELALVLGRDGRDIDPADAWNHVFGYTAINDVTARDLQKTHKQWFLGKSLDGFAPMGPLLVHRSVMPAASEITVRSHINGELRQDSTFDNLIFDVPTIIATLSRGATLLAGDIIATGTPAGVGIGFDPPKFLQPGDEVIVEVTGVGPLINRVAPG